MTLENAYNEWKQLPENKERHRKTKEAFVRAWCQLDMHQPCSHYTMKKLADALSQSRSIEADKVNAASVMVDVLKYAHQKYPKFTPEPKYTYTELYYASLPKDELEEDEDFVGIEDTKDLEEAEKTDENNPETMNTNNPTTASPRGRKKTAVGKKVVPTKGRGRGSAAKVADPTLLTDDELLAEIRRRGWKGGIDIVIHVEL